MSALSQDFVYGYVSDTLEGGCQGDIRFEYTNGAKTSADFLNYENTAQKLAAATPPRPSISPPRTPTGATSSSARWRYR